MNEISLPIKLVMIFTLLMAGFIGMLSRAYVASAATPSLSFNAYPTTVSEGEPVALTWHSTNADYCTASGSWSGKWLPYGSENRYPEFSQQVYTMACVGPDGKDSQSVTVYVTGAPSSPSSGSSGGGSGSGFSVNLSVSPNAINLGQSAILGWSTAGATSCLASGGWSGTQTTYGSITISPAQTKTYSITCFGSGGQSLTDSETIIVNPGGAVLGAYSGFNTSCATSPANPYVGQAVTFAAASSGGTGTVNYSWSGTVVGSGQTQNATFSSTGVKTANVTGTDSSGRTSNTSCSVTVINAPIVSAPAPKPAPIVKAAVKPKEPDYDAICLAHGYVKPVTTETAVKDDASGQEVTEEKAGEVAGVANEPDEKKDRSFLAALFFGEGGTPAGLNFFIILLLIFAASFITVLVMLRKNRGKLEALNGNLESIKIK